MKKIKLALIAVTIFVSAQTFAQNSGGHYDTDAFGRKVWASLKTKTVCESQRADHPQ